MPNKSKFQRSGKVGLEQVFVCWFIYFKGEVKHFLKISVFRRLLTWFRDSEKA